MKSARSPAAAGPGGAPTGWRAMSRLTAAFPASRWSASIGWAGTASSVAAGARRSSAAVPAAGSRRRASCSVLVGGVIGHAEHTTAPTPHANAAQPRVDPGVGRLRYRHLAGARSSAG